MTEPGYNKLYKTCQIRTKFSYKSVFKLNSKDFKPNFLPKTKIYLSRENLHRHLKSKTFQTCVSVMGQASRTRKKSEIAKLPKLPQIS